MANVEITRALLAWYESEKRDLPWRRTTDPYRIWISEIMLQQTRVQTVIDYYERFLDSFPDVETLANADFEDVLKAWEGLGYYRRSKNLYMAAKVIAQDYSGQLPEDVSELEKLPGFGFYTASAVASIAFRKRTVPVDGNIVRVLSRLQRIATDGKSLMDKRDIQRRAMQLLPSDEKDIPNLVQSLMELGALICLPDNPKCKNCPIQAYCAAKQTDDVLLYPIRIKKDKLPVVHREIAMIYRNGKILMVKRAENGLLASMWEFPALCEHEEIRVLTKQKLFQASHIFTHLKWVLEIFSCRIAELSESSGMRWFTPDEVQALALPVVFRRIWNRWLSEKRQERDG